MDQDTYEQLMQIRISLDELEEKINLVLDEIDELKINMEEKPCGHLAVEQQRAHAQERIGYEISGHVDFLIINSRPFRGGGR